MAGLEDNQRRGRSSNVDDKPIDPTDRTQFEALVQRYRTAFFHFALRSVHDAGVAEEVVQEAFLNVWKRRRELAKPGQTFEGVKKYLFRIVRNLAVTHYREKNRDPVDAGADDKNREESGAITEVTPENQYSAKELFAWLKEQISPGDRQIFQLIFEEQRSDEETAEVCGIKKESVRVRVSRLRTRIKEILGRNI